MIKKTLITLITVYQKTLSPDHGKLKHYFPHGYCKYYPTCSQYTKESIEKYGSLKGVYKGTLRVARCNPLSGGGVDKP